MFFIKFPINLLIILIIIIFLLINLISSAFHSKTMKLILILFGFYYVKSSVKSELIKQLKNSKKLILSNHSSYLDILYIYYLYSPLILQINSDQSLTEISVYQCIKSSIHYTEFDGLKLSLKDFIIKNKSNQAVLIFPGIINFY